FVQIENCVFCPFIPTNQFHEHHSRLSLLLTMFVSEHVLKFRCLLYHSTRDVYRVCEFPTRSHFAPNAGFPVDVRRRMEMWPTVTCSYDMCDTAQHVCEFLLSDTRFYLLSFLSL